MATATKAEQFEIYKQEVAECHALLKRARVALEQSNRVIDNGTMTPTHKAVFDRNTTLINEIPEAL
jgi:hypothetical protein